jgi:hypothetical protein
VNATADGPLHQSGAFERLDVLRRGGERHLVRGGKRTDGLLSRGKAREHRASRVVAEGAKDEVEPFFLLFNHAVEYAGVGDIVNSLVE